MAKNESRWDVIKRNALCEFQAKAAPYLIGPNDSAIFLALLAQVEDVNLGGPVRPANKILDEWSEYGRNLIDNWDIRLVGKLIEIFPSCVPKHWHGRKLTCWIADTEEGHWMVGLM